MKELRIYFNYQHTDDPWGGANNFIKLLHREISRNPRFRIVTDINDDYDILFLNQFSCGPSIHEKKKISLSTIKNLKAGGCASFFAGLRSGKEKKKIIVRAVNLQEHSYGLSLKAYFEDRKLIQLLNLADYTIFQSSYQKSIFDDAGYRRQKYTIIHNGANPDLFNLDGKAQWEKGKPLIVVSATASPRKTKNHRIIAAFSDCKDVQIHHFGTWPAGVDAKKIIQHGFVSHEKMIDVYHNAHVFLHPAIKDPCPNVLFEAILAGLPIIYHPGPGSSAEIVKENGIALNENNLEETVEKVKQQYPVLMDSIVKNRNYYSVMRAVQQYIDVFTSFSKAIDMQK
jgi:glycosyltransferase involved in cell wall biosynthesis